MKKHIPNFITCLNVLTGAVGCLVVINGQPEKAIYFILLAGTFDFIDGLLARTLGVMSEFGKQLDSLADMISFGILPAFVLHQILAIVGYEPHSYISFWPIVALLIVPFSALRLAKFNLATDQSDEFKGLPTPANALMIGALAFSQPDFVTLEMLIGFTLLSCFLLVSNIPMIALKFKTMGWKGNELRYSLIVLEIVGLAVFQLAFIPFVIPAYIVLSVVGNFLLRRFLK